MSPNVFGRHIARAEADRSSIRSCDSRHHSFEPLILSLQDHRASPCAHQPIRFESGSGSLARALPRNPVGIREE